MKTEKDMAIHQTTNDELEVANIQDQIKSTDYISDEEHYMKMRHERNQKETSTRPVCGGGTAMTLSPSPLETEGLRTEDLKPSSNKPPKKSKNTKKNGSNKNSQGNNG